MAVAQQITRLGWMGLVLGLCVPSAQAGPMYSLGEKLQHAAAVQEFYVPIAGEIPEDWPNESDDPEVGAFPDSLVKVKKENTRLCRVFRREGAETTPLMDASEVSVFSSSSRCWRKARQRGGLHTLVFVDAKGQRTPQGVEHERGRYTDLNPAYSQLIEAIEWSLANREDAAAARQVLTPEQTNPYLLLAAAASLQNLEGIEALSEVLGDHDGDFGERTRIPPADAGFCEQ